MEIINKVQTVTGTQFIIQKTTPRKGEYTNMTASVDKAKSILHWQPKKNLEDSIKSLITWYNNCPQGWKI